MNNTCVKQIEESWKQKTVASNELFNQGKFDAALNGYKEALTRAETLNNNDEDAIREGIPSLQLFIISCNNLSNTYEELGLLKEAEKMLKRAVHFLLHLSGKKKFDLSEIQAELKRASLNYLRFAQKHQIHIEEQAKVIYSIKEELIKK